MLISRTSHIPFNELPSEARALFSINAIAVFARYGARPHLSELTALLETVWNGNRLRLNDLADPFQMTKLLKAHFAAAPASGDAEGAQ